MDIFDPVPDIGASPECLCGGHRRPALRPDRKSAFGESALGKSALGESALGEPALGKSALGKSTLGKSTLGEPALGKSALGEPALRKSSQRSYPRLGCVLHHTCHLPAGRRYRCGLQRLRCHFC